VRRATALLARGTLGVADVADRVHLSERQLQRRFAERVGYGPKTFQRIERFQRAVAQLGREGVELARAAALAGYADQAHLTRESRRLAGLSPRELVSWMG
jgi:AraC-like DNA-binding protein